MKKRVFAFIMGLMACAFFSVSALAAEDNGSRAPDEYGGSATMTVDAKQNGAVVSQVSTTFQYIYSPQRGYAEITSYTTTKMLSDWRWEVVNYSTYLSSDKRTITTFMTCRNIIGEETIFVRSGTVSSSGNIAYRDSYKL